MKKNETNLEVMEVDAEEIPLEEKIENSLIKANVTDAVIKKLEEQYSGMKLKSVDDKENYLQIKEAKKNVRAIGIIIEKTCKAGREDAIKTQKLWLAKEKELLSKIDKVQLPLESEIKKFDDEVLRKENEEKERREKAFQERQATLIKYGAQYNNGSFELNHISYEIENIKDADEEIWQSIILPKFYSEFEKNEAEKVRMENERAEAARLLKEQQDKLKAEQEEFERQKKELADQQAAMQKIKDDAEREKRLEEQKRHTALMQKRYDQLFALGMKYDSRSGSYVFEDVNIDNRTEINLFNDEEWAALINKITLVIEERKKAILEKQIAEAEVQKQKEIEAALQKERDRVAEEKRLAQVKEEQEKKRKEEELAKASDKEKWDMWLEAFGRQLPPITMRSTIYKSKVSIAKEKIEEILSL
jgi:hypothetical protein